MNEDFSSKRAVGEVIDEHVLVNRVEDKYCLFSHTVR